MRLRLKLSKVQHLFVYVVFCRLALFWIASLAKKGPDHGIDPIESCDGLEFGFGTRDDSVSAGKEQHRSGEIIESSPCTRKELWVIRELVRVSICNALNVDLVAVVAAAHDVLDAKGVVAGAPDANNATDERVEAVMRKQAQRCTLGARYDLVAAIEYKRRGPGFTNLVPRTRELAALVLTRVRSGQL